MTMAEMVEMVAQRRPINASAVLWRSTAPKETRCAQIRLKRLEKLKIRICDRDANRKLLLWEHCP